MNIAETEKKDQHLNKDNKAQQTEQSALLKNQFRKFLKSIQVFCFLTVCKTRPVIYILDRDIIST